VLSFEYINMKEYTFIPYDQRFPSMFSREKTLLRKVLPFATRIEHFGSTAVPRLKGKGILDVYVLVPKNKTSLSKRKLIEVGYDFYNLKPMNGGLKMIFRKKYTYASLTRKVNIHVGTIGIKDFEASLIFRDNLRSDTKLCREYEKLKRLAIKKTQNSGEDSKENSRIYVEAKESFIKTHNKHM
jgi:GrpB-like predicted nucleotidyltransferase (UPF0157 family)